MYEAYYHFSDKPFRLSPSPHYFFVSKGHSRAMAYLLYGVHLAEGFIVITGEIGAGKTMLARKLASKLKESENLVMAQLVSTRLEPFELLCMVAAGFGLPEKNSKAELLRSLEQFLIACHGMGKRALLLVDEAQNLPLNSLEELRMLSNFECDDRPLLQSFLLGQPEFRNTLGSPALEQLRQRVLASYHLGPMTAAETQAYIIHRLTAVGWRGDPSFSDDAYAAIHQYTVGIPRKINVACDRLLLMGFLEEIHAFTGKEVANLISELQEEFAPAALEADKATG